MTRLWRKLNQAIEGRMRQRITGAGFGFSITISFVFALAFLSANNLLFLLLACLISTLIISGFLSRLSLAGLALDFVFPEHISARRKIPARMKLRNEKSWMPSFSLQVTGAPPSVYTSVLYFPVVPGGAAFEETVEVYFERRGEHKEKGFLLRSRFPFGFAERSVHVHLPREALVYPCLDARPGFEALLKQLEGEMDAQSRGRSHDFYRIRPYDHLESARHLDWRATAHTGEVQVREFAREQEPLVEILLDLDALHAPSEWFERAVDCCAYLCWELTSRQARLRFRTQTFDVTFPAQGDVYVILKYLARVRPIRSRTILEPGQETSVQVVFSPEPRKLVDAGWHDALLLDLASFGAADPTDQG